jgi:Mannosyltransferase (PIG-V)
MPSPELAAPAPRESRVRELVARLGAERVSALRYALIVLVASRAVIWLAGAFANAAAVQNNRLVAQHGETGTLGHPWDSLVGFWNKWDSTWFQLIADQGYDASPNAPAFFPLYPITEWALSPIFGRPFYAGLVVSLVASFIAFYLLIRLTHHELGQETAHRAVVYLAICPMAFFLSAAYSEALFLALTLGAFWAARRGCFLQAGLWGGLAALTRSSGLLILVPLAIMYVQHQGGLRKAIHPRALWLALVPAGTASFAGYLWWKFDDPLRFVDAQDLWQRELTTPIQGLGHSIDSFIAGIRQLWAGPDGRVYWPQAQDDPIRVATHSVELFVVLVLLALGVWLAFRFLPAAYGWYGVASLLLPISSGSDVWPLHSLPRFGLVMFPVFIGLAAWTMRRQAAHTAVLVAFPLFLGVFITQWVFFHWVS